ncbi:hypothetical protein AABB24_034431 [Solanum stoloniferum]|uniref:Uncharacterized protein n=1 Tax=Solanum stoloniferum TaxID=62892 RepID=A0ABD2RFW4_9SOLN
MLERPRNEENFLISRIIQRSLLVYSISHSSKRVPCTSKIVSIKKNISKLATVMQFPQGLLFCQHPPLSDQTANLSIQTVVPKITAIPLSSTCSMDISPSYSDGSLVSMDESMSTFDIVRSPEVEYIDDHELAAVDPIKKKV